MGIISISIPSFLLKKMEEIGKERGYSNRSEIIRDAIRKYVSEYEAVRKLEGFVVGNVTIIYPNLEKRMRDDIRKIQHSFDEVIVTSLHLHFDRENCLNLFIIKGEGKQFKKFIDSLMSVRGEKRVTYSVITVGRPKVF